MMLAAMYLRKSRAEENAPVDETLARHRDALRKYASAHGITVIAEYREVASGDSLHGRPEMLRLLGDTHKYDAVLCMDIDRLGRGAMREQGFILESFRDAGTLIVTPGKTYNLRDDLDDSLISFKALFAREEYKLIRGRLRRGVMRTIQEGGYVSNAPYGYRAARVDKCPTLVADAYEAEAVRLAFELYAGGDGCQMIADKLHALGYRPHRGDKFNRTSIAKLLRNPAYIGKVVWNQRSYKRPKRPDEKHRRTNNPPDEWIVTDGRHDPIVDVRLFEKVNAMLRGKYHPPYRKSCELKNPLAGVLFCAVCGKSMSRQPSYGRPHSRPIVLCPTKGCCMSSSQDVVEQGLYATLSNCLADLAPEAPETLAAMRGTDTDSGARAEVTRLQGQLAKLHDLLEQGIYDTDTFLERRGDLLSRIAVAEGLIKSAARRKPAPAPDLLTTVTDRYWDGTPGERNRLVKSIVRRIEYEKPKGSGWNAPPVLRVIAWA